MDERVHTAPPDFLPAGSVDRFLVEATSRALRGDDCADLDRPPDAATAGLSSCVDDRGRLAGGPGSLGPGSLGPGSLGPGSLGPGSLGPGSLGPGSLGLEPFDPAPIALDRADEVDAGAVARWVVNQYGGRTYPGAIIGSRHGAAAHLAAAMGVPWLPVGFEVDIAWPGGCVADAVAAMVHGAEAADRILAGPDEILVRQVHDPVGAGFAAARRVRLLVRWPCLPDAYRRFLDLNVVRGATVLLLRDLRAWNVLHHGGEYSFQVGSPQTGPDPHDYVNSRDLRDMLATCGHTGSWRAPTGQYRHDCAEHGVDAGIEADLRHWIHRNGGRLEIVRYREPGAFSAAVGGIYRNWLRHHGAAADRLVVGCGRLLDPLRTIRAGAVPYWCENATSAAVDRAELWVAGSEPFASIDAFPEPPGHEWSGMASMAQWTAVTSFAARRGGVADVLTGAYPLRPVAPGQVSRVLARSADQQTSCEPLTAPSVMDEIHRQAVLNGLLATR